jgi:hypothetical protein
MKKYLQSNETTKHYTFITVSKSPLYIKCFNYEHKIIVNFSIMCLNKILYIMISNLLDKFSYTCSSRSGDVLFVQSDYNITRLETGWFRGRCSVDTANTDWASFNHREPEPCLTTVESQANRLCTPNIFIYWWDMRLIWKKENQKL